MKRVVAASVAAFVCLVAAACGGKTTPTPTPTHVVNVFFDGVNHGDFRQTCAVWRAGRASMGQCERYLAEFVTLNGTGEYRVIPHSEKGWREGRTEVASVKVRGAYGVVLTARLVKTRHGWLIVRAG